MRRPAVCDDSFTIRLVSYLSMRHARKVASHAQDPPWFRPRRTSRRPTAQRGRDQSACTAALEWPTKEGAFGDRGADRRAQRVAKTTLYRRWLNAACIVMDAFLTDISLEIGYRRRASMEESFVGTVRQLVSTLKRRHGD